MQAARGTPLTSNVGGPAPQKRYLGLFLTAASVGYAADLATKTWAIGALKHADLPVIGDFARLHLTFNPGAAFSTGTGYTWVFTCLAIVAVLVIGWVVRRLGDAWWAVGLGVLLAGVSGNLTDRLFRDPAPFRGHVVDFISIGSFPVFNVADICINIAAGLIIVQTLRGVRLDGTREAPTEPEATS